VKNKTNFLKIGIFIFPIILVIFFSLQSTIFENNYYSYDTFFMEDGPVEYATFVFYLSSSIISVIISAIFIKTDKKLFGILYLILFGFFTFMAFEEISWGQRIFDLESPDLFLSNKQNEINFHNLPALSGYAVFYYMIMGIIGTFGWVLYLIKSNTKYNFFVRHFIPKWYFATFFIPGIMLSNPSNLLFNPQVPEIIQEMLRYTLGEVGEFFISLGIFVFVLSVFFKLKSRVTRINKQIIVTTIFFLIIPSSVIISIYFSDPYVQARVFHGNDLSNIDLSNAKLVGINLTGTILVGVNFTNANLEGADLSGIDLTGTILVGANLENANLEGADLSGNDLTGTTLFGANLANANLAGADLTVNQIAETKLTGASITLESLEIFFGTMLVGVNLANANLAGADLSGNDLTETVLVGVNFTNANLEGADLSGIDLTGTILVGANLENANLEGAILDCLSHPICN